MGWGKADSFLKGLELRVKNQGFATKMAFYKYEVLQSIFSYFLLQRDLGRSEKGFCP
jgi:hypothetical protein